MCNAIAIIYSDEVGDDPLFPYLIQPDIAIAESQAFRLLPARNQSTAQIHMSGINSAGQVFVNRQCKQISHYERKRFVLDYNSGLCTMAELCRQCGIVGNADYRYSAPRQQEWA